MLRLPCFSRKNDAKNDDDAVDDDVAVVDDDGI